MQFWVFVTLIALVWADDRIFERPLENPALIEGDILSFAGGDIEDRNAVPNDKMIWKKGIVPYELDGPMEEHRELIEKAMDHIMAKSCVKFVPKTDDHEDFIHIFAGRGCYSSVGRVGGVQVLSLGKGCWVMGNVIHELLHALGFYHEHNRSDRDEYLKINWENIQSGMEDQFKKLQPHENRLFGDKFDYNSIMLYGERTFSKDWYSKTMESKFPGIRIKEVYEKDEMSSRDVFRLRMLYAC